MFVVKRLASGSFWNVIGIGGEFALKFLLSIMVARFFRPEGYGVYATVLVFTNLTLLLTSLGFDETANILAPKTLVSAEKDGLSFLIRKLLRWRIGLVGLVCVVIYFAAATVPWIVGIGPSVLLMRWSLLYIFSMAVTNLLGGFYTGLVEIRFVTVMRLVQHAGIVSAVYFLALKGYGIEYIMLAMGLVTTCIALAYLTRASEYFRLPSVSYPVNLWQTSIPIWATNALSFILGKQSDILLIGYFALGSAEIGYYDIAFMLVWTVSYLFSSALGGVVLTKFSELAARGERERLLRAWDVSLKYHILVMVPPLVFLLVYARPILIHLYTSVFEKSVISVQVFAALHILGSALGGASGLNMLYSLRKSHVPFIFRLVVGVFNVLVNLILIPIYGGLGALIGTGVSRVIVMALENSYVMKVLLRAHYPFEFLFKVLSAIAISMGLTRMVFSDPLILQLIFASIVYVLVFGSCLMLFAPFDGEDLRLIYGLNPRLYRVVVAFPTLRFLSHPDRK